MEGVFRRLGAPCRVDIRLDAGTNPEECRRVALVVPAEGSPGVEGTKRRPRRGDAVGKPIGCAAQEFLGDVQAEELDCLRAHPSGEQLGQLDDALQPLVGVHRPVDGVVLVARLWARHRPPGADNVAHLDAGLDGVADRTRPFPVGTRQLARDEEVHDGVPPLVDGPSHLRRKSPTGSVITRRGTTSSRSRASRS